MFKLSFHLFQKSETSQPVPERNIKEDFNDLSTYSDKKLSNKSVKTSANNSRSPYALSSHEKYPVSPRRRFLSTGSYDSPQQFPISTGSNITNELIRPSKGATVLSDVGNVKKLKDKAHNVDDVPVFPLTLENVENFSTPTRLSPLFSQDEISSPALSGIGFLDQTESVEVIFSVEFMSFVSLHYIEYSYI